jgi:hypothetical protein
MAEEKTLKQENLIYVRGFIIANLLVFWLLAGFKFGSVMESLQASFGNITDKIIETIVMSALVYISTVIICGLFSSNFKYILIFWRLNNPLPGCRIFSELMEKDPRIDPKILTARYGSLPTEPSDQNRLWYKIYKKHEGEKSVLEAQKHFLLMRELASISFLLIPILGVSSFFAFHNHPMYWAYLFSLGLTFLLTSFAARNYGIRFATNVLAIETVTEMPNPST